MSLPTRLMGVNWAVPVLGLMAQASRGAAKNSSEIADSMNFTRVT
jgi:hypothetical protein